MTATTKKKYVTKEVLEDFSFPEEQQVILRILKSRGNNLHQVVTPSGEEYLVSMPPKFRKHIWVRKGSYVIAEEIPEGNKVKAEIVRILLQDQIKHFKENNVWPQAFYGESEKLNRMNKTRSYDIDEDLLPKCSSDDEDSDDDIFVQYNPNKYLLSHQLNNSESDDEDSDVSESEETDEESDSEESS